MRRTLHRALRTARHPRRAAEARRIRNDLVERFFGNRAALDAYEHEVRTSGLIDHLLHSAHEHKTTMGGNHSLGNIGYAEGIYLYAVLRKLRPLVAVETGVANGFSSAFSLLALKNNGEGHLHSIDLPREVGRDYEAGTFYEGEGRAGIPAGSEPGWLIPPELRDRWTLILGKSQEELPPLLERLGEIDSFMHDSEHSFDCMWFEYNRAWPALREGGVLFSDDVNSTEAFPRFAEEQDRTPIRLARGMAFLVKGG